MEIEIKISTSQSRILPLDDNMIVDVSVKGMTMRDVNLFADLRPLVAAVMTAQIDAAKLDESVANDLKAHIRPSVFGANA